MARQADGSELFIRFHPAKLLKLFLPVVVLIGLSVLINPQSWTEAQPSTYRIFAAVAALVTVGCLTLPHLHYLHLSPSGLTINNVVRQRRYAWDEIQNIRLCSVSVEHMPAGKTIVFDLADDSPRKSRTVRTLGVVNGYDVSILATFTLTAEQIVALLNQWRQRYATGAAADAGAIGPPASVDTGSI